MGCANSKKSRCQRCKNPYIQSSSVAVYQPVRRSKAGKGTDQHFVALTSTTIGSLHFDSLDQSHNHLNHNKCKQEHQERNTNSSSNNKKNLINKDRSSKKENNGMPKDVIIQDKVSSEVRKIIPKTPTRTPPGEPENINTWELMEGLDEANLVPDHCFSFHNVFNQTNFYQSNHRLQEAGLESPKPLWLEMANKESSIQSNSIISDFDPDIINTFRKALEELSPRTSFKLRTSGATSPCNNTLLTKDSTIETKNKVQSTNAVGQTKFPPFGHDKVVIYFTSLRGVRTTYEDCCYVRMILKGSGFRIDERDVLMHKEFREELIELLGDECNGKLPKVFVKGMYLGDAEVVRQMHEDGKLQNILEGCEVGEEGVCEMCGDVRFIPCESCSGSCKIYCEEEDDDGGIEIGGNGVFQRCPYCNENGIVRCPVCCHY
ncbi:hypothetical protein C5167_022530 [Papaver somniferum]|uniref:Glutaredoxin domain-containing protein n=1 Tax=Papaver somniferum TaxID=3469 RepID=A0A4Y7JI95_PAPSO|nr:uncharacterized protein At3g28850-like [Papaver somniferum]RZC60783.1 hypothetical protein C5167_022530 [Papaver somniferum]